MLRDVLLTDFLLWTPFLALYVVSLIAMLCIWIHRQSTGCWDNEAHQYTAWQQIQRAAAAHAVFGVLLILWCFLQYCTTGTFVLEGNAISVVLASLACVSLFSVWLLLLYTRQKDHVLPTPVMHYVGIIVLAFMVPAGLTILCKPELEDMGWYTFAASVTTLVAGFWLIVLYATVVYYSYYEGVRLRSRPVPIFYDSDERRWL